MLTKGKGRRPMETDKYNGFKVGDKVSCEMYGGDGFDKRTGIIQSFFNAKIANVRFEGVGGDGTFPRNIHSLTKVT